MQSAVLERSATSACETCESRPVSSEDRYQIVERIGAGGIGEVFKIEDRVSGRVQAMKIMPRARGVANLRSEFLALARLRHDNIVSVSDYGLTESGHDYFTMDYVNGPPLLEAVEEIPSPQFYQLIGGVLRALTFIHSRGMVHADIKPSNILIDGSLLARDPSRAARLVDFGLAAAVDDTDGGSARGTFPYAAPEVYAGRLDARSDLYAVGVVLYEMATGVQPYTGRNVREVLAAQRRGPPEDPRTHAPHLPSALAEMILALIDPVPGARPQTADEVLAYINEIAGTDFAIVDAQPLVDLSGVLVGRERDLPTLQRFWREAQNGQGMSVMLSGEEGVGKTRLMTELKLLVQLDGGQVYMTDVAARSDKPYAGIAKLVRGLLASTRGGAKEMSEWRRTLVPLLGGRLSQQHDHASRYALAEAVTGVLFQLASSEPLLVLIDDVQQADAATIELLAYLIRSVPDASVLMILGVRQGAFSSPTGGDFGQENAEAHLAQLESALHNAERGQQLELAPLDRPAVSRLVEQAFGPEIARHLGDDLYRVSSGNPSHATRAMEMLVQNGTVGRERGAWVLKDDAPTIPLPADVRVSAISRISQLPLATRRVLNAAAVLGESFTREILGELIASEEDDDEAGLGVETGVDPALAEAVRARLVIADAAAGTFRFTHGRVANLLYRELPESERRELHQRAAQILEQRAATGTTVSSGALAHHYLAVGDYELAISWGIRAAEEHARSYDHHGALAWYHRLRPYVEERQGAHVDERLGDLYALLGKVEEACTSYERAYQASTETPADHIRLARQLGDLLRRRGDGEAALELLLLALAEAREHELPIQEAQCHLRIGWVLMYRADYDAAMEHAMSGQIIARNQGDKKTAAELGRLRGAIVIFQGDAKSALAHLEAALDEADATHDDALSSGVLLEIGRAAIHGGDYIRAIDALEKAIAATERVGHIELTARCLNNLGAACYFQGDWQRARTSWERFRSLCDRFDEQSELVNALNNLGALYRELGQFNEALSVLDRAAHVAAMTGHTHMAAMIQGNRGEVLFRRGDLSGARTCYEQALNEFQRIGARVDIIETRRRMCELDIAAGKVIEALDLAIDTAREAKEAGAKLEEGILHRVAANALRLQGDHDSAHWFIERAREILTTLGARYERAKVELTAAELGSAHGHMEEAQRHFNAAIEAFASLGARWDLSVARSRKRSLVPPQQTGPLSSAIRAARVSSSQVALDLFLGLTQALANVEIERLLEIALDKILALTHFERSFILLLDQDGRPMERMRRVLPGAKGFGRDDAEFSGTIVRRVAANGQAASITDIAQEDELRDQKSVVALGLRQVMCAPMRAHGRVIGIIYIDSRRLSFEEHGVDLVLLEAFAAQVALAVENSRLMSEEKRKGELMAILAHEVRNPLAGILGYSDIGEAGDSEEVGLEATEVFKRIRVDAERLRRLVDNVLELARHESGNVEWSMMSFDIRDIIYPLIDSNQPSCEQRQISLKTDLGELHSKIFGNPDRLMQVLANLIGNAIKFTPPQGRIMIKARNESVAATDPKAPPMPASEIRAWTPMELSDDIIQEFVRVDVIDTGPGMNDELRTRLFEKFSQGAGRKRSSGVGLGLYISREIVMRHGGTIWVESQLGKGTTFSFRIPVAAAPPEAPPASES
ncbi:protein kinase domain-containing protein [Haliangium ochraceum]|uniref:protein kinase domain-containing protein n=1 Tax=Haliangium ochraceum TaxID=80816 RepID=UPI0018EFE5B1|nr:tetratricopeptide repeat protein [Haliangium ochraceum]